MFINMNMRPKDEQRLPTGGTRFNPMCGRQVTCPPSPSPARPILGMGSHRKNCEPLSAKIGLGIADASSRAPVRL
jgi:hypothetical protein